MKLLSFSQQKKSKECGTVDVAGTALPYIIERSARRQRTIAFYITAQRTLRIVAPMRTRLSTIQTMLREQSERTLRKLFVRHQAVAHSTAQFTHGSKLSYLGNHYKLHITQNAARHAECRVVPHNIFINIPDQNLSADALRDEAKLEFTLWLKKRARVKFKKRMDLWAQRMGVSYKRLTVTNPERQWGSCSADNSIRLNWRLMMAPLPLLDYVVAHELAHCVHKNHGPRFWRFVISVMPDCAERRHQLRNMHHALHF